MKILIAILLILHGLIVAAQAGGSFKSGEGVANPAWLNWWPANLGQSWLLSRLGLEATPAAAFGGVLYVIAGAALIAAGLGMLNVVIPMTWWPSLAAIGAIVSLLMLVTYLHPFYVIGLGASLAVLISIFWTHWPSFMRL